MRDLDGRTELTSTVDIELRGAARILSGVAAGRIRSAVAENLEVLRQLLESGREADQRRAAPVGLENSDTSHAALCSYS